MLQLAGFLYFSRFFYLSHVGWNVRIDDGKGDREFLRLYVGRLGHLVYGATIYSLVGAKSRTPVGIALTILSSISFIGSLIAPLLIGAISQAFNMKYAYIVVGLLGLCILLMTTFCKAFKNN